jgi:hypothetical protein
MKKLLTLTLVLCFTLLCAGSTLAAVHNFTGDFDYGYLMRDYSYYNHTFEGWYYIGKDAPSATVRSTIDDSCSAFGAEYFQNDQTFVNLTYFKADSDFWYLDKPFINLKGSYLFANNFFIGLDTGMHDANYNHDYSQVTFSPGYRSNLANDAGYIAASVDYAANDEYPYYKDSGIIDYELNGRYYTAQSRFYGQLIIPNKDVAISEDSYLQVGGAYQYSNNIICGADIYIATDEYTAFELGCSTTFDQLGAEFRFMSCNYDESSDYDDYTGVGFNILYSFADQFRTGFEYLKFNNSDDPKLHLKAKYTMDDQNSLILTQRLKNDTYEAVTFLYWDIKLK